MYFGTHHLLPLAPSFFIPLLRLICPINPALLANLNSPSLLLRLCTCCSICEECFSPTICMAYIITTFRPFLTYYLLPETFPGYSVWKYNVPQLQHFPFPFPVICFLLITIYYIFCWCYYLSLLRNRVRQTAEMGKLEMGGWRGNQAQCTGTWKPVLGTSPHTWCTK